MAAVLAVGAVADVYPRPAVLPDELVEVEAVLYVLHQLAVLRRVVNVDVGGLPGQVLRVRHAADRLVQRRAAVAAVDVDGLSVPLAQRVEHVVNQRRQIALYSGRRHIADALGFRRVGAAKLRDCEVSHIVIFLLCYFFVYLWCQMTLAGCSGSYLASVR